MINHLIEEIVAEFSSLALKKKPKLLWKIDGDPKESISIDYSGGVLRLEANNERNLVFCLSQAIAAVRSGHMGEYLGKSVPRFPLRPLRVFEQPTEGFCKSLCRMGYNAVILSGEVDPSVFQAYGLKVFTCQTEERRADGVFWESNVANPDFLSQPDAFDLTIEDMVNNEMRSVENSIGNRELIYYVPFCEAHHWLPGLMDNAGPRTTIAFPAVAGDPAADYLPFHPFWETLRSLPDTSATPLLPVINTGSIAQGECLWPAPPIDLLEQFLPRLSRHNFSGFIGMANRVPEKPGFLHLSLWTAAQALWHGKAPRLTVETWLKAFRPDLEFSFEDLTAMREIVKGARQLQTKERQGAILANLTLLDLKYKQSDYFPFFASDMRNLLQSSDGKDSFWTKMQMGKPVQLERPQNKTALMNKIILENT